MEVADCLLWDLEKYIPEVIRNEQKDMVDVSQVDLDTFIKRSITLSRCNGENSLARLLGDASVDGTGF